MSQTETTSSNYTWLITFLLYDNAWYDKKHKGETGYISLEEQNTALYAAIEQMTVHEKIKIVLLEAKINLEEKVLEISMRTKTGGSNIPANRLNIPDLTAEVMSNTQSLTKLLQPVIEADSADRHMIITIGHGSIFGINLYSEKNDTDNPKPNNAFIKLASQNAAFAISDELRENFKKDKYYADRLSKTIVGNLNIESQVNKLFSWKNPKTMEDFEVAVPELNITVLTVKEIGEALLDVYENKPVDIMVLDNCLMQNIFTQYELSKKVNYLVAAESGISYPGFNYKAIIEKINTDITISPENVAHEFVDEKTVLAHPAYSGSIKNTIDRHWCINAVSLNKADYENIKLQFDRLFSSLNSFINSPVKKIREEIYFIVRSTNNQLFGYNLYSLPTVKIIDLNVFLIYLKKRVTDNTVLGNEKNQLLFAIDELKKVIDTIKVKSFIGENFYPAHNFYVDEVNKNQIGFGFLLPLKPCGDRLIDLLFLKNGKIAYTPSFLENSEYFKFISRLWKMAPPNFI